MHLDKGCPECTAPLREGAGSYLMLARIVYPFTCKVLYLESALLTGLLG